jgi:hypothetical protein
MARQAEPGDLYTLGRTSTIHKHTHTHKTHTNTNTKTCIGQLRQGDTVILEKGLFRGPQWSCGAVVGVPNVTIKGQGIGKTVVDCSGAGIHASNRCVCMHVICYVCMYACTYVVLS